MAYFFNSGAIPPSFAIFDIFSKTLILVDGYLPQDPSCSHSDVNESSSPNIDCSGIKLPTEILFWGDIRD